MTTLAPIRHRPAASELAAAGGVIGVGVAVSINPAGIEHGPILCPFRAVTGLPCPGCGLTRSWVYGAHGEWAQSFSSHPFGLPLLIGLLVLAVVAVGFRLTRREPPNLGRLIWNPVGKLVIAGWLVFAVVRMVLAI